MITQYQSNKKYIENIGMEFFLAPSTSSEMTYRLCRHEVTNISWDFLLFITRCSKVFLTNWKNRKWGPFLWVDRSPHRKWPVTLNRDSFLSMFVPWNSNRAENIISKKIHMRLKVAIKVALERHSPENSGRSEWFFGYYTRYRILIFEKFNFEFTISH